MNKCAYGKIFALLIATFVFPFMASASCESTMNTPTNGGWGWDTETQEGCFIGDDGATSSSDQSDDSTSTTTVTVPDTSETISSMTSGPVHRTHRTVAHEGLWAVDTFLTINTAVKEEQFMFLNNLYFGIRNDDVTQLQARLIDEGVYNGPVTGYFGPLTKAAAKRYQKANSIKPVKGYVGPITRKVLNSTEVGATKKVNESKAEIKSLFKKVKDLKEIIETLKTKVSTIKI